MSFLSSKLIFFGAVLIPPLICYVISKIEDRSTIRWSLYGLFFGVFAVIYLMFYAKPGDKDRMPLRMMILLGLISAIMFVSIFEPFF